MAVNLDWHKNGSIRWSELYLPDRRRIAWWGPTGGKGTSVLAQGVVPYWFPERLGEGERLRDPLRSGHCLLM